MDPRALCRADRPDAATTAAAWCRSTASPRRCAAFARRRRARGCNVTVPFKFEAAALAQHLSPRAALAQRGQRAELRDDGIHGDNSDGVGLVNDITRNAGVALAGARRAADRRRRRRGRRAGAAARSRPRRVVVANRTLAKADRAGAAPCGARAARIGVDARGAGTRCGAAAASTSWSTPPPRSLGGRRGAGGGQRAEARRAGDRHDVRPGRRGLHGLGARRTAPCRATAWACWSSRRPRPSRSGAACARPRRRCWPSCAPCVDAP